MGLVCGTPTRFMPAAAAAAAAARTAKATTITPALGAGVKKRISNTVKQEMLTLNKRHSANNIS